MGRDGLTASAHSAKGGLRRHDNVRSGYANGIPGAPPEGIESGRVAASRDGSRNPAGDGREIAELERGVDEILKSMKGGESS